MSDPQKRPPRKPKGATGGSFPWTPPTAFADADVFAVQALSKGIANEGQQKRAWEFIHNVLCENERLEFWPDYGASDGRRASDFAGGKRFVSLQLTRFARMQPAVLNSRGAPPDLPNSPTTPAAGDDTKT